MIKFERREAEYDDAYVLTKIIETYEPKLTHSDKINFAYEYYDILGNLDITDILFKSLDDKTLRKEIYRFICSNSMEKKRHGQTDISIKSFKLFKLNYNRDNWLEPYDEEKVCHNPKDSICVFKVLNSVGDEFVLDKNLAKQLKLSLFEENIFPANIILKEGFRYYANGQFDEFIRKVKSGDVGGFEYVRK